MKGVGVSSVISSSLLIVYGTEDEAVSAMSVEGATRLLTEAGVAHEVVAIDGADHTFMRYEW